MLLAQSFLRDNWLVYALDKEGDIGGEGWQNLHHDSYVLPPNLVNCDDGQEHYPPQVRPCKQIVALQDATSLERQTPQRTT